MESLESSSQSQKAKCFKFSSELSFKPKSMGSKLAEIFNQFEIPSPHYLISQIEELIKQESDSQSEVYMQEWMERIDEQSELVKKLKFELTKQNEQNLELINQMKQLKHDCDKAIETQKMQYFHQLEQKENKINELKEIHDSMQSSILVQSQKQIFEMKMENEYSQLAAKNTLLEERIELLETQKQDLNSKLADKDTTIEELNHQLEFFEAEMSKISDKNTNYEKGCKSAADHIAKLISLNKEADQKRTELEEKITSQEKLIKVASMDMASQKEAYEREIELLKDEVSTYKISNEKIEGIFQKKRPDDGTKLRLKAQVDENLNLKNELNVFKMKCQDLELAQASLRKQIEANKKDLLSYSENLKFEKNQKIEFEINLNKTNSELSKTKMNLSLLEEDYQESKNELDSLKAQNESLEKQNKSEKRTRFEFERENEQLKFTIESNKTELEELRANTRHMVAKLDSEKHSILQKLENRVKLKQSALEKEISNHNMTRAQIDSLKQQNSKLSIEVENLSKKADFFKSKNVSQRGINIAKQTQSQLHEAKIEELEAKLSQKEKKNTYLKRRFSNLQAIIEQLKTEKIQLTQLVNDNLKKLSEQAESNLRFVLEKSKMVTQERDYFKKEGERLKNDLSLLNNLREDNYQNLEQSENPKMLEKSYIKSPNPHNQFIDLTTSEIGNTLTTDKGVTPQKLKLGNRTLSNAPTTLKHSLFNKSPFKSDVSQSIVFAKDLSMDDTSLLDIQKALVASEKNLNSEVSHQKLISDKSNLKFPSLTEDNFYLSVSPQKLTSNPPTSLKVETIHERSIEDTDREEFNKQVTLSGISDSPLEEDLDFKKIEQESLEIERRITMLKNKAMKKYKKRSEFRRSLNNSSRKNKENEFRESNPSQLSYSKDFKVSSSVSKQIPLAQLTCINNLEGSETPFQSEHHEGYARVELKYAKTMNFLHRKQHSRQEHLLRNASVEHN